jgi:Na+-translocating ferredoxin:NAD+ oxidoreductase RnfD subunit
VARLRRFARSPKGRVLVLLLGLAALAGPREGPDRVAPAVALAILSAGLLDLAVMRLRRRAYAFPDGAVVSGLIVALVLSPEEPWYVPCAASGLAILSKHLIRTPRHRQVHVFNPAAFGLLAGQILFSGGESWWGALPELPLAALPLLLGAGFLIVDRVNKMPQVLAFAGTYVGTFTMAAFLANGGNVRLAEVFRPPFINEVLFFAFFMLTDPPTSPNSALDQAEYGFIVGLAGFFTFLTLPGLGYLLLALLIGNVWLAWCRARSAARRRRSSTAPHRGERDRYRTGR